MGNDPQFESKSQITYYQSNTQNRHLRDNADSYCSFRAFFNAYFCEGPVSVKFSSP